MCDQFETARVNFLAKRHRRLVARYEWTRRLIRTGWWLAAAFFAGMQCAGTWHFFHGANLLDGVIAIAGGLGCAICLGGATR